MGKKSKKSKKSTVDVKARCSYCMKEQGRDQVKNCSGCRLARYCSKECQAAAWPDHRKCCGEDLGKVLEEKNDTDGSRLFDDFTKWTNHWRDSLQRWALWALNPTSHPDDRLATHAFVIELERRPNPPSPLRRFRMIAGSLMSRELVEQNLRAMNIPEKNFDAWKNDLRGNFTIQIVLVVEGMVRFLWLGQYDAITKEKCLVLEEENKDICDVLAYYWEPCLKDCIERGEVIRTDGYLHYIRSKCTPAFIKAWRQNPEAF